MQKIIFSEEQLDEMKRLYQEEGKSTRELGTIFGCSRYVISDRLKKMNVELNHISRKYYFEDRIFQNIDTAEKAYWLGFLAADGCNYQREENATIVINIHQKDREQLEKFRTFLKGPTLKIHDYVTSAGFSNNTPMCKISVNSKIMSQDLADKGVIPKKSLILEPPKISEEFYLPFILGYFDGDGSINSSHGIYCVSFEGTREMLEWINNILDFEKEKLEKRNDDDKNSFTLRCGGTKKPYNILKKLYDSCDVRLTRKYERFKELETVVLSRNAE